MPKERYEAIYRELRRQIEEGVYPAGSLLPSEVKLTMAYACARNTVRRALARLVAEGYIQPIQGRGVQVIYKPKDKAEFIVGGIESFRESALRNHRQPETRVVLLEEIETDAALAERSSLPLGSPLWHIERVRYLDGVPLIRDINYFLKSEVGELTEEIARDSVYAYLEQERKMVITLAKRRITAEHAQEADSDLLELNRYGYDFVAVLTGKVFNSGGVLFEFTQSRHRPDALYFYHTATRPR